MELRPNFKLRAMNMTVAVLEAATLGSLAGSTVMLLVLGAAGSPFTPGWDLLLIPVAIVIMAFAALFVMLPALVLIGMPLAFVFARYADAHWTPALAILLGSVAGWLVSALINLDLPGAGLIYGAAAGWFWYWRVRLVMIRIGEDKLDASSHPQSS